MVVSRTPSWLSGRLKLWRIDGQATPRTPSGRPRLMKATKARASRAVRVRGRGTGVDPAVGMKMVRGISHRAGFDADPPTPGSARRSCFRLLLHPVQRRLRPQEERPIADGRRAHEAVLEAAFTELLELLAGRDGRHDAAFAEEVDPAVGVKRAGAERLAFQPLPPDFLAGLGV